MTLYHVAWCPECEVVRQKLAELDLEYEDVVVPDFRPFRTQVHEVSGQSFVPVLKDGDTVLTETGEILAYLEEHYAKKGERLGSQGGQGSKDDQGDGASCPL